MSAGTCTRAHTLVVSRYWPVLVVYGAAVVGALFCWYVLAPVLNESAANSSADSHGWYALIGFRLTRSSSLWYTSFVGDTVILIFAAIQVPQYRREISGIHGRFIKEVFQRRPWLDQLLAVAVRLQRLLGAICCYILCVVCSVDAVSVPSPCYDVSRCLLLLACMVCRYIILSLIPENVTVTEGDHTVQTGTASFRKLITLVMAVVCIFFHMAVGVRQGSGHSAKTVPRLLFVMAVLQAIFLIARYMYQFQYFFDIMDQVLSFGGLFTAQDWGLERYAIDSDDKSTTLYWCVCGVCGWALRVLWQAHACADPFCCMAGTCWIRRP